jgi:bacterioferritin
MNEACRILNDALATEIVCVMRYRDHQMIARKLNSPEVSMEFSSLARNKEQHLRKIAERISQLGGSPDFDPESVLARTIYPYESLMGNELIDLIQDDLVAERVVIDIYQKLIHWFKDEDFVTHRMLEEFIKDDENNSRDLLALVSSQFQSH